MKRFFSLLVALVLLVSMFALPTFAFADGATDTPTEEPARTVGFSNDAFKKYVIDTNPGFYVEMSKEFKLNQEWTDAEEKVHQLLNDEEAVKELFPGIHYQLLPEVDTTIEDTDENKRTVTYKAGDHAKVESEEAGATVPDVVERNLATQHVTLKPATTFTAADGYKFGGWLVNVTFDGQDSQEGKLYRAGDKFSMPDKNVEVVAQWIKLPAEDSDEKEEEPQYSYPKNDVVCLEYCTPSNDPHDDNWTRVDASKEITVETAGWWMFRYVVVDGDSDVSDDDAVLTPFNDEEFKAARYEADTNVYDWAYYCLKRYAVDNSHPQIELSSSMQGDMKLGLTVGKGYTIPTSLTITESSDKTTTYKVYRHKGNGTDDANDVDWELIYDSAADVKVLEAGEKYITSGGLLTPLAEDNTGSVSVYRYKVVYSVKDTNGYFAVAKDNSTDGFTDETGEFHPVLLLGVRFSLDDQSTQKKVEAWKIVLFVIAGLSAVGIVVLLLIKPKQQVAGDERVGSVESQTQADTQSDDENK